MTAPRARRRSRFSARHVLVVLLALTLGLMIVDRAAPGVTAPLRAGGATVLGPVERLLGGQRDDADELRRERDAARRERDALRRALREAEQGQRLGEAVSRVRDRAIETRVVGFAPDASGQPQRVVTIDAGSRRGLTEGDAVLAAEGLAGRVLRVSPWTADVVLLGDPRVVVGVRVGAKGSLGSVAATLVPGLPPRDSGELTLTVVDGGSVAVGDQLTTLGGGTLSPYPPGIPVGTVVAVDPDRGQLGRTAVVRPHVDPARVDLLAAVPAGQPKGKAGP